MYKVMLLVAALAGCGDNLTDQSDEPICTPQDSGCHNPPPPSMSWNDACTGQAVTWCDKIGFGSNPSSGCALAYQDGTCHVRPAVLVASQNTCLMAIRNMTCPVTGCVLPDSCAAIWN